MLKWRPPREYRSLTYNQSNFELKNTNDQTTLELSKIGEMSIHLYRDVPDDARVKQVPVKREKTCRWYAISGIETEDKMSEKPTVDNVDREDVVGIGMGILKYAYNTDSTIVGSLALDDEYERLEREQQELSHKKQRSQNWHEQRRQVARIHVRIVQRQRDFRHKLSAYYAREYGLAAVKDLDIHGVMQLLSNN
ncbi:hypothetical protein DMJ13_16755 [halophilic archaeon]|nr:hypothetical protein DMJ13_16755 [halophilic archaeon]